MRHTCEAKDCSHKVNSPRKYCARHNQRINRGLSLNLRINLNLRRMCGSNNLNWNGGTAKMLYPNARFLQKQRIIVILQNPDCEICGTPAAYVHHKDGSKSNHRLANLQAVCPKCHAREHIKLRKRLTNLEKHGMKEVIGNILNI